MNAKQSSISSLFAAAKTAKTATTTAAAQTSPQKQTLISNDPLIQEFYNSLSPYERITHSIAIEKLGTSYDVTRTHGFLKWKKART
jgi:hypothetical protein